MNPSTGPKTPEGKAASSRNALKSGIYAKSRVLPGEDPKALEALTELLYEWWNPATPEQASQVDMLVHAEWTLRRLFLADFQMLPYQYESTYSGAKHPDFPAAQAFDRCGNVSVRLQYRLNSMRSARKAALDELRRMEKEEAQAAVRPQPAPEPVILVEPAEVRSKAEAAPQPQPAPEPPQPVETEPPAPADSSFRSESPAPANEPKIAPVIPISATAEAPPEVACR